MSPYDQGWKDFRRGQISNPHKPDTKDHRDWQFGFNKAYFLNLEKINGTSKKKTTAT